MKKAFRLACCLSATCVMFAFSACAKLSKSFVASDSSEKSYAEDEWNPSEDAMVGNSSVITDGTENETDSEDISVFEPTLPDDEKEILRMETGDIGHKIVYYTDGTCEDLGRITPIDFKPISPAEKEGYQYFSTLEKAEGLCAFYQEIFTVACNFHASDKNVTFTEEYCEIADMNFFQHGLTSDEAASVWHTVSLEYPEFFWWGKSLLLGNRNLTFLIDPLYAKASARESAQLAIESMVYDCDTYLDGTTTMLERALTIHDYVANITQYAYEDDYVTPESEIWAHNIAGGAQYGKGVCETYAKTYDYLCHLFALPCITATGFAVQDGKRFGHAWNVVNVDGSWYNVDATWNDLDSRTLSREWFGKDPEEFALSHDESCPEDGWSVNYMFALPTLAEEGITPVRAANTDDIKSGKYTADTAPMYPSIEDVCGLIGEGDTYETYLYPRTAATLKTADVLLKGATLNRITHTAGTLVIHGKYKPLIGGYFEMAELSSPKEIVFLGDVVLRDLSYAATSIDLNGNTLTTAGTAVEISTVGGIMGGDLTDKTTDWTEIFAVDLGTVTAQGNELRLLGGGKIDKANIHSGVLRLSGAAATEIGSLWYATADVRLYIDSATNTTKITIGDITAGTPADEETGAAVVPEKVTIFVVYTSAKDYPIISVAKKSTGASLHLLMYSDYSTPEHLRTAFINLSERIPLSQLRIAYSWHGVMQELLQARYEKKENGDVCWK